MKKMCRDQFMEQGIECLLPVRTRMSHWKGESKQVEWPLFPHFCFWPFQLHTTEQYPAIPGVIGIIGSRGTDDPIPPHEIAALRRVMQSGGLLEAYPYRAEEGITMTVAGGPLQGLHAKVVREGSTCHLIIAVACIKRAMAVIIATKHVVERRRDRPGWVNGMKLGGRTGPWISTNPNPNILSVKSDG